MRGPLIPPMALIDGPAVRYADAVACVAVLLVLGPTVGSRVVEAATPAGVDLVVDAPIALVACVAVDAADCRTPPVFGPAGPYL